jgi:hypothetical protein
LRRFVHEFWPVTAAEFCYAPRRRGTASRRSTRNRPMRPMRIALIAALGLPAVLSCGGGGGGVQYHLENKPGIYTMVNLHPDPTLHRLYSTNYQQEGLIPVCTPVTIVSMNAKEMKFRAEGNEYQYLFAKQLVQDKSSHLDRIFGTSCPDTAALSQSDLEGIKAGKITPGMTRQGVILAAGYPPDHVNQLDSPVWKYWKHKFGTFDVIFEGDNVKEVKE